MTDCSKIDFTQLKLEPIGNRRLSVVFSVQDNRYLVQATYPFVETMAFAAVGGPWVLLSGAIGINREQANELWKRTEQVDEFIKQQSLRRITVLELIRELVNTGREISVIKGGSHLTYRLNRDHCGIEYIDTGLLRAGFGDWATSSGPGRPDEIVTIVD